MRFAFALSLSVAALVLMCTRVYAAGSNGAQYDGLDLTLRLGPPSGSSSRIFNKATTSIAPGFNEGSGDASSSRSSTISDRSRGSPLNEPYFPPSSGIGSWQRSDGAVQGHGAAVLAQGGDLEMPNEAVRRHASGTFLQYTRDHYGTEQLPIITSDGNLNPQGAMLFQERIRDLQATKSSILQAHNWPLTNEELATARRRFHNWHAIAVRMAPRGQPVKVPSKIRQQALTDIELMSSMEALLHRIA